MFFHRYSPTRFLVWADPLQEGGAAGERSFLSTVSAPLAAVNDALQKLARSGLPFLFVVSASDFLLIYLPLTSPVPFSKG